MTDDPRALHEWFKASAQKWDDDAAIGAEVVAALKATGTLDKRATLIYGCAMRNCRLLYVLIIKGQRYVHVPRYKLSDEVNQRESVEAARAKRTLDGDRRWIARTFILDAAAGTLQLQCDHCRAKVHVDTIIADIDGATRLPTTIRLADNDLR